MNSLKILTLNAGLLEIDFPLLRAITLVKQKNIRVYAVIDALKKATHDIVMLQEVGGSLLKKILCEVSDVFPYHVTHHARKLFSTNLLILSKFPLNQTKFIPYKNQTHFESWGIQKGMLCAQIVFDKIPYHFINTHLVASGTEVGDSTPKTLHVRNQQIEQLKEHIRTSYDKNDIVIVGGDFNAGPLTCRENYDIIIDELYDCMQHAPEPDRITWSTKNPIVRKSTKHDPDKQIDGFYMRHHHYEQFKDSMSISRKFIEETEIIHKEKLTKTMLSDHYGVELEIKKHVL